jgi:K+-transporting ATPase ATPase B chain
MQLSTSLWSTALIRRALGASFLKLNPVLLWRNPVMLVVEILAGMLTVFTVGDLLRGARADVAFSGQISLWLWLTVWFATFAEALAEGRGKAQAETLRRSRQQTVARRLGRNGRFEEVPALRLKRGDVVLCRDGDPIPSDGEIIEGVALVDESAVTGESAPVLREAGGDRCGVTGGTRVVSGTIKIRITADPGQTFVDRMIEMVEAARRQKTPNERALELLLVALTILFIVVVGAFAVLAAYLHVPVSLPVLVSLLVCLMPTTIGGLLPAIGIAGMDRLLRHNIIALSGRAVEAAGDVSVILLDKTGTITLGNRVAVNCIPVDGTTEGELAKAALLASLADETPEGRSILALTKDRLGVHGRDIAPPEGSEFIPFSAERRMSGVRYDGHEIVKGAPDAVEAFVAQRGGLVPPEAHKIVQRIAKDGGTPMVVADGPRVLGVLHLKDVLKPGIAERLRLLRQMGIRSIMITGDNPLTAATIAAEAGVDEFIAQARPEQKLQVIRRYQEEGHIVAMIGDGTNDAPALAQADVAVAMNAGTQVAREAANMIDLDSNPTKLLDVVEVGKEILITRGAVTTFSIANDVAKYFAILPAVLSGRYPELKGLDLMRLTAPQTAILAAVIFNALIIPALIPLALHGVRALSQSPMALLVRNVVLYGIGGVIVPFLGIKLLDTILVLVGLGR